MSRGQSKINKKKSNKKSKSTKSKSNKRINRKTSKCPNVTKCAPGIKPNPKTCSCLSRDSLVKIASQWNNDHQDRVIKYSPNSSSSYLWKQIDSRLKDKCKYEWCWIQQEFVKRLNSEDITNSYKPIMPSSWHQNKYEWLRTDNIENVMHQYEKAYPDFTFIGPVPIDFDKKYSMGHCVVDELCKINLTDVKKDGYSKIGIVFNLDPHDKPGSHWVSMYCSIGKNKGIYYFDSFGVPPPREVDVLMHRLQQQGKDMGIKLPILANNVRHQYKNSECGVYSLFFITQLLKGKTFKKLINSPVLDETMNNKRKYFFVA